MLGYQRAFLFLSNTTTFLSLVFAMLFVKFLGSSAQHWVLGMIIGQVFIAIVGARKFPPSGNWKGALKLCDARKLQSLFQFSWPISVAVGLAWVQTQSYRLLSGPLIGLHEVGLLAAGIGLSVAIIAAIESIMSSYLLPEFYKKIHSDEPATQESAWRLYAKVTIPIYILTGCYLASVTPELVDILMGPTYANSSKYVYWGIVAEIARASSYTMSMILHARNRTWLLIIPAFFASVTSMLIFYTFVNCLQAHGIGLALAIAGAVNLLVTWLVTKRQIEKHVTITKIAPLVIGAMMIYFSASLLRQIGITYQFLQSLFVVGICGLEYLTAIYLISNQSLKAV